MATTVEDVTADAEEAAVRAFIAPDRRAQYLARLGASKTRQKFMTHLHHMRDLDQRYAHRIPPGQQNAEDVLRLLRERGASERCYVISASSDYDGQEIELTSALRDVFDGGSSGTIIACDPDHLGYFQGEEPGEGYILDRPAVGR